jgi:hypothetical protein
MNIFRVLASGKHNIREEFVSAFLAYLLSPKMDHGLGYIFLSRLLAVVAEKNDIKPLGALAGSLRSRLWENIFDENQATTTLELEMDAKGNRIDAVLRCKNWLIAIENKIALAAKADGQLKAQYEGLRAVMKQKGYPEDTRVLMVYLVPASFNGEAWSVASTLYDELEKVSLSASDCKVLVSWQPVHEEEDKQPVSIVSVIRDILHQESMGNLPPIGSEVRHILLSFVDFAMGEFQGFYYEKPVIVKKEEPGVKVSDVMMLEGDYYVGIQHGRGGILSRAWRDPRFADMEVSLTKDDTRNWHYLPLKDFQAYARWAMDPETESLGGIKWSGSPFGYENLYRAAKWGKTALFIGVKGGLKALNAMSVDAIKERKIWYVLSEKKSNEWIPASDFCRAIEEKGLAVS